MKILQYLLSPILVVVALLLTFCAPQVASRSLPSNRAPIEVEVPVVGASVDQLLVFGDESAGFRCWDVVTEDEAFTQCDAEPEVPE